jgi:hypothetical protein
MDRSRPLAATAGGNHSELGRLSIATSLQTNGRNRGEEGPAGVVEVVNAQWFAQLAAAAEQGGRRGEGGHGRNECALDRQAFTASNQTGLSIRKSAQPVTSMPPAEIVNL